MELLKVSHPYHIMALLGHALVLKNLVVDLVLDVAPIWHLFPHPCGTAYEVEVVVTVRTEGNGKGWSSE